MSPDFGRLPRSRVSSPANGRILGVHCSGHDATVAVIEAGSIVEVVEFERVIREKRCRMFPGTPRFANSLKWLFTEHALDPRFDLIAVQVNSFRKSAFGLIKQHLKQYVGGAPAILVNHHLAHAASAYFTSPFSEAAILSFDGRGNDGTTIGFSARDNKIRYARTWPRNFGAAYRALGSLVGGITEADKHTAGKTMGLAAYGDVIEEWKPALRRFVRTYSPLRDEIAPWEPAVADGALELPHVGNVGCPGTLGGPSSLDAQCFARTFQSVWTEELLEVLTDLQTDLGYKNLCLVGGSALNAIANRSVAEAFGANRVHFIPNCNDSGLAVGAALYCHFALSGHSWLGAKAPLSPFLGVMILDIAELENLAAVRRGRHLEDPGLDVARLLAEGKTVGVLRGKSEVGPRALGHRSILAPADSVHMKQHLNERIKFREWYRPYAPAVRREDVSKYFDIDFDVPYMSLVAKTLPEWRAGLPAVTHVDGSARVQTVTSASSPFLYDVLSKLADITQVGVCLNTSLNTRGMPMVSTIRDAFAILDDTALDFLLVEDWLFEKSPT